MRVEDLVAHYPVLYHMAAEGSWPSISRHGLLSTSSLLDLFHVGSKVRDDVETKHRPNTVTISHPKFGEAQIRDQKPMSDAGLQRALTGGLSPGDWYRLLNSKVFFWTSESRLHRLLCARAYRDGAHDVLFVDTAGVVQTHSTKVNLCPINSGATKPFPHPRGRNTFSSISAYPWGAWIKKRGIKDAVVEVAFEGGIRDIAKYVRQVIRMRETRQLKILFER